MRKPLAEYIEVRPPVSLEARVIHSVEASRGGARRGGPTRRAMAIGALVGAAAILAFAVLHRPDGAADAIWVGASVATEGQGRTLRLRDGSTVELAARSHVALVGEQGGLAIRLGGRARFAVAPQRDGNHFRVLAGSLAVVVVGTQFTVEHHADTRRTRVEVHEGVVRVVEDQREVARVAAGQMWSREVEEEILPRPTPESDTPREARETRDVETSDRSVVRSEPPLDRVRAAIEVETTAEPRRDAAPAPDPNVSALLRSAIEASRRRDAGEAARLYQRLIEEHPDDTRAAYAAFQLGRLRMDSLHDPRGAADAFERAVRGASPAFREDAMSRRVLALEATGDRAACGRARGAYLEAYPEGVHLGSVTRACPP